MQLTVRDVARLLNVAEKTVYRWITQGSLPAYRVNEQYRFNRAELLEWAMARRINVSEELLQEPESTTIALPTLAGALKAGGIVYRLNGVDKPSVLQALVDNMRLPEDVDREFLYRVLLAREALGSTGIGDGIAIPHVRNPIVLHVSQPAVTLCFLERPVDFGSLDGQPVHTLFSLISPAVRAHLHLLSRLSFALRDPQFKAVIQQQGSRDQIMNEALRVDQNCGRPLTAAGQEAR
ncbi:MAG: PTS sugar transporter subunit IIA [Planctomycetes bacterium]|nr:PTS sugar transporter subunit IIA [Planctomycetota bacterium]